MITREEIKPKVIEAIKGLIGNKDINEADRLERDLGMSKTTRESLAGEYTNISSNQYGGKPISKTEAGLLTTVRESIDLVTGKANEK